MSKQVNSTKEKFCLILGLENIPPAFLTFTFSQFLENTDGDIYQIPQKQNVHRQNYKKQHRFPDHTANSGFNNRAYDLPSPLWMLL